MTVRAGRRWPVPAVLAFALALVLSGCGPSTVSPVPGRSRPRPPSPPRRVGTHVGQPRASRSRNHQAEQAEQPSKPAPLLERGDQGGKVRELQHRLRRLDWFSGSITGVYGKRTVRGVKGFQAKREIAETGEVDRATWASLVKRTRKPSNAELHNRLVAGPAIMKQGSSGDRVRDLQARLKQIGWFSGVGDRHIRDGDRRQRQRIPGQTADSRHRRSRSTHPRPAPRDDPHPDERRVAQPDPQAVGERPRLPLPDRARAVRQQGTNSLVWVVNGKPQVRIDVRFGS